MSKQLIVDTSVKAAKQVERSVEGFIRKAWSIMDAASEKKPPSSYLSKRAVKSIQGEYE
jgi:hypothetical protein